MLQKIFTAVICIFLASCSGNESNAPTTAIETGRDFIRASLNGDFSAAEALLLKDDENLQSFSSFKKYYDRMPEEKKTGYKKASYEINKYLDLNDSTTIINYSNDYMKKPMEIKVVRFNNQWKVDFKYTVWGTCQLIDMLKQLLLVGLGGGIGSMLRFLVLHYTRQIKFPVGTLAINTLGSLFIGMIIAFSLRNSSFNENWKPFLAMGICGGFTTFSAFSIENLQMLQDGKWTQAFLYIIASMVLGLLAAWGGFEWCRR